MAWGCMMPAVSFDGAPWELESRKALQRLGFAEVSDTDMYAIRQAWQGVLHRTDFWTRFWGEFSLASDPEPSSLTRFRNIFLLCFTIL
jgi:hypothetical protein